MSQNSLFWKNYYGNENFPDVLFVEFSYAFFKKNF